MPGLAITSNLTVPPLSLRKPCSLAGHEGAAGSGARLSAAVGDQRARHPSPGRFPRRHADAAGRNSSGGPAARPRTSRHRAGRSSAPITSNVSVVRRPPCCDGSRYASCRAAGRRSSWTDRSPSEQLAMVRLPASGLSPPSSARRFHRCGDDAADGKSSINQRDRARASRSVWARSLERHDAPACARPAGAGLLRAVPLPARCRRRGAQRGPWRRNKVPDQQLRVGAPDALPNAASCPAWRVPAVFHPTISIELVGAPAPPTRSISSSTSPSLSRNPSRAWWCAASPRRASSSSPRRAISPAPARPSGHATS